MANSNLDMTNEADRIDREIDRLHADYAARFGGRPRASVGAIYVRDAISNGGSIVDQVQELLDYALERSICIPRKLIFFDCGVGFGGQATSLKSLLVALREMRADTLLMRSLSRLYRGGSSALRLLEHLRTDLGVRCIITATGTDSHDGDSWKAFLAGRLNKCMYACGWCPGKRPLWMQ